MLCWLESTTRQDEILTQFQVNGIFFPSDLMRFHQDFTSNCLTEIMPNLPLPWVVSKWIAPFRWKLFHQQSWIRSWEDRGKAWASHLTVWYWWLSVGLSVKARGEACLPSPLPKSLESAAAFSAALILQLHSGHGFGRFWEQDTPLRFICKLLSGCRWGIRYVINWDTGIEKGRAKQPGRDYCLINSRDAVSCYHCKFNAISSSAVGSEACRAKHPKAPAEQPIHLPSREEYSKAWKYPGVDSALIKYLLL